MNNSDGTLVYNDIHALRVNSLNVDLRTLPACPHQLPKKRKQTDDVCDSKVLFLQVVSVKDVSVPSVLFNGSQDSSTPSSSHKHVLRLKLTDGYVNVSAIEMEHVEGISKDMPPGTKIWIESCDDFCLRIQAGFLLLMPSTTVVLGGRVPSLLASFREEKELFLKCQRRQCKSTTTTEANGGPPLFVALTKESVNAFTTPSEALKNISTTVTMPELGQPGVVLAHEVVTSSDLGIANVPAGKQLTYKQRKAAAAATTTASEKMNAGNVATVSPPDLSITQPTAELKVASVDINTISSINRQLTYKERKAAMVNNRKSNKDDHRVKDEVDSSINDEVSSSSTDNMPVYKDRKAKKTSGVSDCSSNSREKLGVISYMQQQEDEDCYIKIAGGAELAMRNYNSDGRNKGRGDTRNHKKGKGSKRGDKL